MAALLLLCGAAFFWPNRQFRAEPPSEALPALVRNLPNQVVDIEPAFRRRVQARFPDGMDSAALTEDLRHDGFHLRDYEPGKRMAVLEQHDPVCAKTWVITWMIDPQNRARGIGAHFNLGCL